jgi:hypothetical protein
MAETKNPEGPLRSGGGSPNNTMIGEDFMSEWTLVLSAAADRPVPFPEIKALPLQQFPGQLDLRVTLCFLLAIADGRVFAATLAGGVVYTCSHLR